VTSPVNLKNALQIDCTFWTDDADPINKQN